MFGNQNGDRSGLNVKPGVNDGFRITEMFTRVGGPLKSGQGEWKAFDIQFDGAIKIRDRVFVPILKTTPSQYDAEGLERVNQRGAEKGKQPALTMPQYLQMRNERAVEEFIRIINMYAYSFYPDKSPEIQEKIANRQAYETVEDFLANVDTFVQETLQHVVPQNYRDIEWTVLVGKKEGSKYLEFPSRYTLTGRYVKVSSDTSRELIPSEQFTKDYMTTNITTQAPVAAPAASVNWGASS